MTKIANNTFLFTDIESSTRLWQAYPAEMRGKLARHDMLLRQEIEAAGGRVFNSTGDGFCAVFDTVEQAANAACCVQSKLASEEWKPKYGDDRFRIRAAIHCGECEQVGDDYAGLALAETQRLMSAGHGGQILLSKTAAIELRSTSSYVARLRDLGRHRLRDLQQTIEIFQLEYDSCPSEFPPLRTLEEYANNLPRQITRFVGRREQVAEVKGLLQENRLVTITGPGGSGKTRLAVQVAGETIHHYADGAFLIELASLTGDDLIIQAAISSLKLPENSGLTGIESLIAGIKSKNYLIVLDNCEHLIDGCADVASALIHSCPQLHILATSREPLGITGEIVRPLSSLPIPPTNLATDIDKLQEMGSVQLLIDRISAIKPQFRLSKGNAPSVVQICRSLDGIPLALELAGACCSALSVEQLAQRMSDPFKLLSRGSRTATKRQQTLRAMIDWSYDLLTRDEQTLLAELSIFSGGWTLEAAEVVCGVGLAQADVLTVLTRLVEKSLVVIHSDTEPPRYRLLETLREYARERISADNVAARSKLQYRHFSHFCEFASDAKFHLYGSDQREWIDRVSLDHDNIRSALSYGFEHNLTAALLLATNVYWFWYARGYQREWRGWFATALQQGVPVDPIVRCKALIASGNLNCSYGDLELARANYQEAADIALVVNEQLLRCHALSNLAMVLVGKGQYTDAVPIYTECLACYIELNDEINAANVRQNLGSIYVDIGDLENAEKLLNECILVFRKRNLFSSLIPAMLNIGEVLCKRSFFQRSVDQLKSTLSLALNHGNKIDLINSLRLLSKSLLAIGDVQSAIDAVVAEDHERTLTGIERNELEAAEYNHLWSEIAMLDTCSQFNKVAMIAKNMTSNTLIGRILAGVEENTNN